MRPEIYQKMAEVEERHWWHVARRRIISHLIAGLELPAGATILEAGCGPGGNLATLARHGRVIAFELDDAARAIAHRQGDFEIYSGHLPDGIPPEVDRVDLITLLDVLEHLDDEVASLNALYQRLVPGGWLIVAVPAVPILWSHHDETHHHRRRYRKRGLAAVVTAAGFEIDFVTYYNFWLFPVAAGVRMADKLLGRDIDRGMDVPPDGLNKALAWLFASERYCIGRIPFPFGLSLILRARRPSP